MPRTFYVSYIPVSPELTPANTATADTADTIAYTVADNDQGIVLVNTYENHEYMLRIAPRDEQSIEPNNELNAHDQQPVPIIKNDPAS